MGLRRILTDKEPALHKVCRPVEKFDWRLHKLLDDMAETLAEANGVGLAAPQVGILKRVVLVDTGDEILELINPEMLETSGEQTGIEGCLSVPGKYGIVTRPVRLLLAQLLRLFQQDKQHRGVSVWIDVNGFD